jgi:hypothetical protein
MRGHQAWPQDATADAAGPAAMVQPAPSHPNTDNTPERNPLPLPNLRNRGAGKAHSENPTKNHRSQLLMRVSGLGRRPSRPANEDRLLGCDLLKRERALSVRRLLPGGHLSVHLVVGARGQPAMPRCANRLPSTTPRLHWDRLRQPRTVTFLRPRGPGTSDGRRLVKSAMDHGEHREELQEFVVGDRPLQPRIVCDWVAEHA